MAERSYSEVKRIFLSSPEMNFPLGRFAAVGKITDRAQSASAAADLAFEVDKKQDEYLASLGIRKLEFNVNNNSVQFYVEDVDGTSYSVASEDQLFANTYSERKSAETRAERTGDLPESPDPTEGQQKPEQNNSKQFSIMFDYKKTTAEGEQVDAKWRYKFTLPVEREPGVNDQEEALVDPDNGKKIADESTSLLIAMVKNFLGLGAPLEVTPNFDVTFESALTRFQDENRDAIYEEGGFNTDPTRINNIPIISGFTSVEIDQHIPEDFLAERGRIGVPTYKVLLKRGFMNAAKQFLQTPEIQSQFTTAKTPDDVFAAFETKVERQESPAKGTKYYNYTFVSEITKRMRPEGLTIDDKISMFRKAVNNVFEYYAKEKEWTIDEDEEVYQDYVSLIKLNQISALTSEGASNVFDALANADASAAGDAATSALDAIDEASGETPTGEEKIRPVVFGVNPGATGDYFATVSEDTTFVDVLHLQDLRINTKRIGFARITAITSPNLRPNSVYTMTIQVRRDMFDEIPTGRDPNKRQVDLSSLEGIENAAQDAKELYEKAVAAKQKFDDFRDKVNDMIPTPSEIGDAVEKWAEGQARKAAEWGKDQLKNMWDDALSRDADTHSDLFRNATAASVLKARQSLKIPKVVTYEIKGLVDKMVDVATEMDEHHAGLLEFKEKNKQDPAISVLDPDVNLDLEARRFSDFVEALSEFCALNEVTIDEDDGTDQGFIRITYLPVVKSMPRRMTKSDDPNSAAPPQFEVVATEVGFEVVNIEFYEEDPNQAKILEVGVAEWNNSPWTFPSSVAYFMQLNEIYDTIGKRKDLCEELLSGPGATLFITKYHYPAVKVNYKKDRDDQALLTLKIGFDDRSLIKAQDRLLQNAQIISDNWKALMNTSFTSLQLEVNGNFDIIPDFSKFKCDIELLYKDFLDSFSFNHIMCDFLRCFPSIGPWSWNFKWSLPEIPKLPSFDPLQFVLPKIKIMLVELVLKFLCKFIKLILKEIAMPNCADVLKFGVAAFSALNELNKDNPYANAKEKASLMEKTTACLGDMGLSADVLAQESEESIASFLDNISLVLTPRELCSLLQGNATDEVASIVLKVVQGEKESALSDVLTTNAEVKEFFRVMGTNVDPYLCDRIKEIDAETVDQAFCDDGERTAREIALDHTTTPQELAEELKRVSDRKVIFDDLLKNGDFSGLMPKSLNPAACKDSGLPGPYSNPLHNQKAAEMISATLQGVKSVYQIEIKTLAEKLLSEQIRIPMLGDDNFDGYNHAKFEYYSAKLNNLTENDELLPLKPIVAVQPIVHTPNFSRIALFQVQQSVKQLSWYNKLSLPYREQSFFVVPVTKEDNFIKPDSPEYQGFIETMIEFVTDYISRNSYIDITSENLLRKVLQSDNSNITRLYPGGPDFHRRLHVRNLISLPKSVEPQEIGVIDAASNVSSFFSVGYSELPFYDDRVKDCYQFSYKINRSRGAPLYIQKIYKEPVLEEYKQLRKRHVDVRSERHRDKLLRPGGFGALMIDAFRVLSKNRSNFNTFSVYEDGVDNIIPKLQGYVDDLDREEIRELFDSSFEELGGGLGGLVVALLLAALKAGMEIIETTKLAPLYSSISDSLNYQIAHTTRKSKYFDTRELLKLETELSTEFFTRKNSEGKDCLVKNPRFLNIEKITKDFEQVYTKYANKPEHEPFNEDFVGPGPFEEGMVESLFKTYVDMVCLELSVKSLYMFSEYGSGGIFNKPFVIDYITELIVAEFFDLAFTSKEINKILDHFKKITGATERTDALRLMVLRSLEDRSSIDDIIKTIHNSRFTSYKEKFYNELVENVKSVPEIRDTPQLTPNNRNAGTFYSLAPPLFNLYDKFNFEGYDADLINKKINSGHFWLERFYRLKNPAILKAKLRQIHNIVGLSPPGQFSDRYFAIPSGQVQEGLYDEYFSPDELVKFLYGGKPSGLDEDQFESDQDAAEYEYARVVYLSLLYDHYNNHARLDHRTRNLQSKAYKLMIILGLSAKKEFSFEVEGGKTYGYRPFDGQRIVGSPILEPDSSAIRDSMFDLGARANTNVDILTSNEPNAVRRVSAPNVDIIAERIRFVLACVNNGYRTDANKLSFLPPEEYDKELLENESRGELLSSLFGTNITEEVPATRLYYDTLTRSKYNEEFGEYYTIYAESWGNRVRENQLIPEGEDNPYEFASYEFLKKLFNPGWTGVRGLSTTRMSKILAGCLIHFEEISTNWPLNGIIRNQDFESNTFIPRRRRTFDPGIEGNDQVESLYSNLKNYGKKMSYNYLAATQQYYRGNPQNVAPMAERMNFLPRLESPFDYAGWQIVDRLAFRQVESVYGDMIPTPAHVSGGDFNLQDNVLDFYISRVIKNQFAARVRSRTNRPEHRKLGLLDTEGFVNLLRLQSDVEDELYAAQLELLQYVNDNLQIGTRLMSSFKVKRKDAKISGRPDDPDSPDFVVVETKPSQIFGDVRFSQNNGSVGNIGLDSDPRLFTKKRAFLGYAYPVDVTDEEGLLEEGSLFYPRANSILTSISLDSNFSQRSIPDIRSYEDITSLDDSILNKLPDYMVYSIPVDEVVEDINCVEKMFLQYASDIDEEMHMLSRGRNLSTPDYIRNKRFLTRRLFEKYEDNIYKKLLSLEKRDSSGVRSLKKVSSISEESEKLKPHRLLFDVYFPLDRYVATHFLQNIEIMSDDDQQSDKFLYATKIMLLSLLDQTLNDKQLVLSNTALVQSAGGPGSLKMKISSLLEMLFEMIEELTKIAMRTAIRMTVQYIDPAYREMRKGYLDDPCSMKAGLKPGLIGPGKIKNLDGDLNWNQIDSGFADVNGCRVYVPLQRFGIDLARSLSTILDSPLKGYENIKAISTNFKNTVKRKGPRYGWPTTPFTGWALSVGEVPSEDHTYLKKQNDCSDLDCESKTPTVDPIGLCEDGGE